MRGVMSVLHKAIESSEKWKINHSEIAGLAQDFGNC